MEAELVSHGVLASGLVSSTLSYTLLAKDESSKEKGIKEIDDQCIVAVSPNMRLVLLVCGYKAQLLQREGQLWLLCFATYVHVLCSNVMVST
jgi:hypothetical protein